jgi:hypothetical protein
MLLGALCALLLQREPTWDDWKAVGPWTSDSPAEGLAWVLPPEIILARIQRGGDPVPRGSFSRDDGPRISWQDSVAGYPVNLARVFGSRGNAVGYLYRSFEVEAAGKVPVELTAAGAYRVWLNGKMIAQSLDPVLLVGSTTELDLAARAGKNHLLVKVAGDERGFAFGLRNSFRWQSELAEMQGSIDLSIDRGVSYLLDRQMIDGSWGAHANYPGGVTPVVLYALLKCGLAPDHPAVQRGFMALRRIKMNKTYSAGFYLLAMSADGGEEHRERVEEVLAWLIEALPPSGVYGYPGSDDLSNHVVAALGVSAAARVFELKVDPEFWVEAMEGTISLQTAEERVELAEGESGYQRGFTYRAPGEASGSMTSAGMTVIALALSNGGNKIGARVRKAAERAIELGAVWLGNHWSVSSNPPNRSWLYFHLYGLERVGSLLKREVFGEHPWYLEGARYLVDNQSDGGTWPKNAGDNDKERDTSMSLLFLKRATSLAVTSEDGRGAPMAFGSAKEADVVLRAFGDTPMIIWVADSRVEGTTADFFASRVGESLELNLGGGEMVQGRWTLRTQFPRSGRWEIWCRLETPGGLLTSPKLPVQARLVVSDELMAAATAADRNLLLEAEGLSWRASSQLNDGLKPEKLADAAYAEGWKCAADDLNPWVLFQIPRGVRAKTLRFVPNTNRSVEMGAVRPSKLRVIINKKDIYEIAVPADPLEKARLDLGKKVRIKQVEVHILEVHGAELGKASIGFCEIELEE